MNCEFETRVSQLLDDALTDDEALAVREHVEGCESCRQLERDFAHLGQAIRDFQVQASPATALEAVLSRRGGGVWKRRVSVPLPLVAAASLALVFLGGWAAHGELRGPARAGRVVSRLQAQATAPEPAGLDRFDSGQPAVLYKVRHESR